MSSQHRSARVLGPLVAFFLIGILAASSGFSNNLLAQVADWDPGRDDIIIYSVEEGQLEPDSGHMRPHPKIAPAEAEKLQSALLALRQETAAAFNVDTSNEAVAQHVAATNSESSVGEAATLLPGAANTFLIPSNVRNTRADNSGNSTLAEPAAANEGPNIFYAGNFGHNEFSTNGGASWTNVPLPAGPADAPTACCDWDVVYDQARGVTFISALYLDSAASNGVVRIFVRRDISQGNNCSYSIDPAGSSDNTVPDYPHINLSNDFLYLMTNNNGGAAGGRAQVRRFNIDQMAGCLTTSYYLFNYPWPVGQRVFVPVEGARETMYWGMHEDFNTMRIFAWNEQDSAPTSVRRNVAGSTFGVNEDCTGGTGNNDWWRSTTASIIGFFHRGAVGHGRIHFYWNVASDANHSQGHIHGAIFKENTSGTRHKVGALLSQPVIFNNDYCFGHPVISANERGDIGMVLAAGGNAGPGGVAARPAVGIDDDFTRRLGVFGAAGGFNFNSIAAATHNRADGRYGDYFTIHPHEPCDLFFNATGYALNGGTGVSNVNARYVEFGRQRDYPCYSRWDDEDPTP